MDEGGKEGGREGGRVNRPSTVILHGTVLLCQQN